MLESDPVIALEPGSGFEWVNGPAREFLSGRGIGSEELLEWLKAGSYPTQELLYRSVGMRVLRMPDDHLLVLLNPAPEGEKTSQDCNITLKERQVLRYLVKGFSNKEIASCLNVSPGTINTHLDNIYRKFGCSSRLAACFIALKKGFAT